MKKYLAFLMIIYTFASEAQEIVDSTKIWSNLTGYCHPEHTVYTTEYYSFTGDTLIDGNNYKLVYISEDEFHEEWFFFGAFIREENGRVYYRNYSGEEGLIYDFNLEPGDTVTINNPREPSPVLLTLVDIDSVETPGGYRERWKLTNEDYETPEYWLRGVGSSSGVINSTSNIFGGMCGLYILLCALQDEEEIYHNPDYDSCYYDELIVGQEETGTPVVPSYDMRYLASEKTIKLHFSSAEKRTIIITDIQGHLLKKTVNASDKAKISLQNQTNGLYVVTVIESGNKPVSRKVMVY